jgi:hypothetical protein
MVIARELSALLMPNLFCLPNHPGNAAVYICPTVAGQPVNNRLLTWTEQATINMCFAREKHYFLSMRNIKRTCFTALDASVNNAFKVSNYLAIQGWHTGMRVINILDQLSAIYSQPTPSILKTNNTVFRSPYLAANAPEVLFCQIEECAETALLGRKSYTDWQLVTNAIRLILTTGLYTHPFEDWDCLTLGAQTWIALQTMIQEAFQQRLNMTPPPQAIKDTPPQCLISRTPLGFWVKTSQTAIQLKLLSHRWRH